MVFLKNLSNSKTLKIYLLYLIIGLLSLISNLKFTSASEIENKINSESNDNDILFYKPKVNLMKEEGRKSAFYTLHKLKNSKDTVGVDGSFKEPIERATGFASLAVIFVTLPLLAIIALWGLYPVHNFQDTIDYFFHHKRSLNGIEDNSALPAILKSTIDISKRIINGEECIERLSCEIGTYSQELNPSIPNWLRRLFKLNQKLKESKLIKRVSRGLKDENQGHCSTKFDCNPIKQFARSLNF